MQINEKTKPPQKLMYLVVFLLVFLLAIMGMVIKFKYKNTIESNMSMYERLEQSFDTISQEKHKESLYEDSIYVETLETSNELQKLFKEYRGANKAGKEVVLVDIEFNLEKFKNNLKQLKAKY